MELILNLTWLAVTVSLCAWWFAARRAERGDSHLPGAGLQWIAIAALSAILLPVISVTDDLQASQNPAEIESSVRKAVVCQTLHAAPQTSAMAITPSFDRLQHSYRQTSTFLNRDLRIQDQAHGYFLGICSRPPPAAVLG